MNTRISHPLMNLRVADRDDDGDARVGAVLARCPVRSGAEEVAAEFDESSSVAGVRRCIQLR